MADNNGVFVPPDITTEVKTQNPLSRAYLGNNQVNITFPFNPDTVSWSYQENITSMDTLGGRVTQLLSVQLTGLEITMRAGSRESFQNTMTKLKEIMGYHTNSLNPVHFKVPSRNWDFIVYLVDIPDAGWDVTATSYPFKLSLEVQDDLTGIKTKQISSQVIANIQKDIGYDIGHHGGNAQEFYSIIETISKNVPGGGITEDPTAPGPTGESGVRQSGGILKDDELMQLSAWALSKFIPHNLFKGEQDFVNQCITAFWVGRCESGGNPDSPVHDGLVGLWQATLNQPEHGSMGKDRDLLMTSDGGAQWMAEELLYNYKNNCHSGGWSGAWWCYWGCYRGQGTHDAAKDDAIRAANKFDFSAYYP